MSAVRDLLDAYESNGGVLVQPLFEEGGYRVRPVERSLLVGHLLLTERAVAFVATDGDRWHAWRVRGVGRDGDAWTVVTDSPGVKLWIAPLASAAQRAEIAAWRAAPTNPGLLDGELDDVFARLDGPDLPEAAEDG